MPSDFAKIQGLQALKSAFEELPETMGGEEAWYFGSPLYYTEFLENGTSRMPPYPWLQPAVDRAVSDGSQIAGQAETVDDVCRLTALRGETYAREILQDTGARPFPRTGAAAGSVESGRL